MGQRLARKVLLIGWDAADWRVATPLLDRGQMPNLARLVEGGVMGDLASLFPTLSPLIWTSVATGKRPHKHGVHGFVEPDPLGTGVRPVGSATRTAKALWNILSQSGLRSLTVGWFASHPAESIAGACVSDLYAKAAAPGGAPWPLPAGAVHPAPLAPALAGLRVHPSEIDGHSLLPFVPRAAEIDQAIDGRLAILATQLAACASVHAAATWLMDAEAWDFMAVYYDAIDHVSHAFMHYYPPRMAGVPERDYELYREVVAETYRYHDLLLGRLLDLAGDECAVILCSDHGYRSDHTRPSWIPDLPAGPAVWHRNLGIVAARGPGIRRDERLTGASVLDVAPTVLHLLGLPVGEDMDGRVWLEMFEEPRAVERIPSWEAIPGADGRERAGAGVAPSEAAAAIEQLAALGYVERPTADAARAVEAATRESRTNLALALMDARLHAEALPLLEALQAFDPAALTVSLALASCYFRVGRRADARRLAEELIAQSQDDAAPAHGRPRERPDVAAARTRGTEGPRLIPAPDLLLGMLDLEEGDLDSALVHLQRARDAHQSSPHASVQLGRLYLRMRRHADAQRAFEAALVIDPDDHRAHDGLSEVCLAQHCDEEAAEHALAAVGRYHHYAPGHYHLGVALARLGMLDRAIVAFEHCRSMRADRARQASRWIDHLRRLAARGQAAGARESDE